MRRGGFTVLALFVSLSAARAQAATVALVRPAGTSPALTETLFRLHGELLSIGLAVEVVDRPGIAAPGDSRAWMERTAAERRLDALLDIVGVDAPAAIDIWVFDRQQRRSEISRVVVDPNAENGAERLAIRAIEVLRSNLLETRLAGSPPARPTVLREDPGTLVQAEQRPASGPAGRIGLEAGAAVSTSLDGAGPAISPVIRLGWPLRSWLGLKAELAGLGSRSTVATAAGSAEIRQQYALLGACYCDASAPGLRLYVALAGGLLRTEVNGSASPPGEAHAALRWSFLLDGSIGARWRSPGRYFLTLAGHVQVAEPYVAVHILGARVATVARPNLLLTLTLGAWL